MGHDLGDNGHEEDIDEDEYDKEAIQAAAAEMEYDWEPACHDLYGDNDMNEDELEDPAFCNMTQSQIQQEIAACLAAEECAAAQHPLITRFLDIYPSSKLGAVLHQSNCLDEVYQHSFSSVLNPWALFTSRLNWEVTKWAKCHGPSSTAFSELLAIDELQEALNLSYKNTMQLNKIIKTKLQERWPKFHHWEVLIDGQLYELYSRDIMECICVLWGDLEFTSHLLLKPEQQFVNEDHSSHQYHDMHTAKWW
ncbi:hypothetical protein BDQ17DRAFT_1332862 [Cyathus striatus]|nr:hypothetical protein BDQ17DRAFT_1332862 [Cyathus striatus]